MQAPVAGVEEKETEEAIGVLMRAEAAARGLPPSQSVDIVLGVSWQPVEEAAAIVKERVQEKEIELWHVPDAACAVDILTKWITGDKLEQALAYLTGGTSKRGTSVNVALAAIHEPTSRPGWTASGASTRTDCGWTGTACRWRPSRPAAVAPRRVRRPHAHVAHARVQEEKVGKPVRGALRARVRAPLRDLAVAQQRVRAHVQLHVVGERRVQALQLGREPVVAARRDGEHVRWRGRRPLLHEEGILRRAARRLARAREQRGQVA